MQKRILTIIIVGALAALGLGTYWWCGTQVGKTFVSQEEIMQKYAELYGYPPQAALNNQKQLRPVDMSRPIRLAVGGLGGWQFFNLEGRLFIADYNSIQAINENGRATKLLASIQRQPPITSLDSQGTLMRLALFLDKDKNLCAAVHNKIYRWNGVDWREMGIATASFQPAVFDDGILFFTDGWNQRPASISCFNKEHNSVGVCLSQDGGAYPGSNNQGQPQWNLPAELLLPNLSASLGGLELFLLADHSESQDINREDRGTLPDGTVEVSHVLIGKKFGAKDGDNSALYWFSRAWRRPA